MALTPAAMGELLREGIKGFFGENYDRWSPLYKQIFDVRKSDSAYEEFLQLSGLGLPVARNAGESTTPDDMMQGYLVAIRNQYYSKSVTIYAKLLENSKYKGTALNVTEKLMTSSREGRETLAATVFNDGFSTNGYDGVPLFSASHVRVSGGTFSNLVTAADLSMLLLDQFRRTISGLTDDRGLQIHYKPKKLVVPTEEAWTAKELLTSAGRPDSTNRGDNPAKGLVEFLEWEYLTDTDATFMTTSCPNGLVGLERLMPIIETEYTSTNRAHTTFMHEACVFSWLDPRAVVGCAGA